MYHGHLVHTIHNLTPEWVTASDWTRCEENKEEKNKQKNQGEGGEKEEVHY